jgi:hypothetical protein
LFSINLYGYSDVTVPILKQPIVKWGEVEIVDGSWLGENVCVLGAGIVKICTIGNNTIVTHDSPAIV